MERELYFDEEVDEDTTSRDETVENLIAVGLTLHDARNVVEGSDA